MSFPESTITQTVTIGAGASLSGATALRPGYKLVAVQTASTWDAAKIAFQASLDNSTWGVVKPKGTEYECVAVTGVAFVPIEPQYFLGARYIKVQSGISTAATAQADATIVTLVFMAM